MIASLVTILIVILVLVIDKFYLTPKVPDKYTNLNYEIVQNWCDLYYGRIYTVKENKVKYIYETRNFTNSQDAKTFTLNVYKAMQEEFGLSNEIVDTSWYKKQYWNQNFSELIKRK